MVWHTGGGDFQSPVIVYIIVFILSVVLGLYMAILPAETYVPNKGRLESCNRQRVIALLVGVFGTIIWQVISWMANDAYVFRLGVTIVLVLMALQAAEMFAFIHPPRPVVDVIKEKEREGSFSSIQATVRMYIWPSYYRTPVCVALGGLMLLVPFPYAFGVWLVSSLSWTTCSLWVQHSQRGWQRIFDPQLYSDRIRWGQRCLVWVLLIIAFIYGYSY